MTEITMPRLTDAMQEGTIVRWLKLDGESVVVGEELVEIETDKAMVAYEAEVAGVVRHVAQEGDTVVVGGIIARIGAEAESLSRDQDRPAPDPEVPETPVAATSTPQAATNGGATVALPPRAATGNGTFVPATPLARRVASTHGVDLASVTGTGPRGRITRADVYARLGGGRDVDQAPRAPAPARAEPQPSYAELTTMQKTVARRMTESKATIPHFQVQTEVRMDAALSVRAQLREDLRPDERLPSLNDMIVKAAALALREHPRANASYDDGRIRLFPEINIGIAVTAEEDLVVPVLRHADQKTLRMIAAESADLAERVRTRQVRPDDVQRGTFTVSNLGMFGMTAITPVINPPQAAILGVGAAREVLAREEDRIVDCQIATLTLSCDHRVLYGADAAAVLSTIRENLEHPMRLLT